MYQAVHVRVIWQIGGSVLLCFMALSAWAMPEICDNATDDDGDGLVDLNDPDCACADDLSQTYLINPSFEELECCPANGAEVHCATGWVQASERTTDFLHTCGWNGWAEFPPPFPFPDGVGAIGFRDGRVTQAGPEWNCKEYVGTCLINPLLAGRSYTLRAHVGFVDLERSPPIDLTLFGTSDCGNLPFGEDDNDPGCPSNHAGWTELGVSNVGGNGWLQAQIKFVPETTIRAIALGPGCAEVTSAISIYYFIDNISLVRDGEQGLTIMPDSDQCTDFLVSPSDPAFDYQWYLDGVAILGETLPILLLRGIAGTYQVRMLNTDACILSDPYPYVPEARFGTVEAEICTGEIYPFGERDLDTAGVYIDTISIAAGCDSIVTLTLRVIDQQTDTLRAFILPGENYTIGGERFSEAGDYPVTVPSGGGCDRNILLRLRQLPVYIPNVFSPNNDGANDAFAIAAGVPLMARSFQVFDRWGSLVFEQVNTDLSLLRWDGRSAGRELVSGVYVYRVVLEVATGEEKVLTGTVTVVR